MTQQQEALELKRDWEENPRWKEINVRIRLNKF